MESRLQSFGATEVSGANEAIRHLEEAIAQGKHWFIALLEAIGLWDKVEDSYDGRHYHYLIAGEAFDWLLLAQRLLEEVSHLIPHLLTQNVVVDLRPQVKVLFLHVFGRWLAIGHELEALTPHTRLVLEDVEHT